MPTFNIKKEIKFSDSFRNNKVVGMFDLNDANFTETFEGNLEFENKDWNIGLIVGNSGTGKTTLAKQLFGKNIIEEYPFNNNSIIDCMPESQSVSDITKTFNRVGFSSPACWLKPYHVLSNGEKMRTELAYNLLSDKPLIVFDEFTSVVDRNIAKILCVCVEKNIRNANKKFIGVGCHFDVADWIAPDWIFDTNEMKFSLTSKKKLTSTSKSISLQKTFGVNLANIII